MSEGYSLRVVVLCMLIILTTVMVCDKMRYVYEMRVWEYQRGYCLNNSYEWKCIGYKSWGCYSNGSRVVLPVPELTALGGGLR